MDNLNSADPGIVDDTSDGDLGANRGEPQYGSLAEHEAKDDAMANDPDHGADGGADAGAGDGGADRGADSDAGAPTLSEDPDHGADGGADAGAGGFAV